MSDTIPSTIVDYRRAGAAGRTGIGAGDVTFLSLTLCGFALIFDELHIHRGDLLTGWLFMSAVVIALVVRWLMNDSRAAFKAAWVRNVWLLLIGLMIAQHFVLPQRNACPHGAYYMNQGIIFFHSNTENGPCHNLMNPHEHAFHLAGGGISHYGRPLRVK